MLETERIRSRWWKILKVTIKTKGEIIAARKTDEAFSAREKNTVHNGQFIIAGLSGQLWRERKLRYKPRCELVAMQKNIFARNEICRRFDVGIKDEMYFIDFKCVYVRRMAPRCSDERDKRSNRRFTRYRKHPMYIKKRINRLFRADKNE